MHAALMEKALKALDQKLSTKKYQLVKLLIGGGGAFALAYDVPLQTADIDGVPFQSKIDRAEFERLVHETGRELHISPDWLNPYFETFLVNLPGDYGRRLKLIFHGSVLQVYALGLTDLLIMKCFAGREKDMPHAKILIRKGADIDFAERHLEALRAKNFPGAEQAIDFLIEAEEQVGK